MRDKLRNFEKTFKVLSTFFMLPVLLSFVYGKYFSFEVHRWYAFFAISFYSAYLIFDTYINKDKRKTVILNIVLLIFVAALTFMNLLHIF